MFLRLGDEGVQSLSSAHKVALYTVLVQRLYCLHCDTAQCLLISLKPITCVWNVSLQRVPTFSLQGHKSEWIMTRQCPRPDSVSSECYQPSPRLGAAVRTRLVTMVWQSPSGHEPRTHPTGNRTWCRGVKLPSQTNVHVEGACLASPDGREYPAVFRCSSPTPSTHRLRLTFFKGAIPLCCTIW